MDRTQFTFYESFYKALSRIRKDADRAKAYDAITRFALYGEEPDMEKMPDNVAIALEVIRPNLKASRRKAEGGTKSKPGKGNGKTAERTSKDAGKISKRTPKQEKEQDKEQEKEKEQDKEQMFPPIVPQGTFDRFWEAYPKKVGKEAARNAFRRVRGVSIETILQAIARQKDSRQWREENGRFIPNPATWLNQGRWEDEATVAESGAADQSGLRHMSIDTSDTDRLFAQLGKEDDNG